MESTARVVEIEAGAERETAARVANARRVSVVEVFTGARHELPGDTPTRDARTLAYFSYPSGAVVPLVMRPPGADFYVCADKRPELVGALVRRCA
jgi:hypothetical protein